jgi:hypothetical protein
MSVRTFRSFIFSQMNEASLNLTEGAQSLGTISNCRKLELSKIFPMLHLSQWLSMEPSTFVSVPTGHRQKGT